jgi:hypothetical protein
VALGIATLCTLSTTGPLVSHSHETLYHITGPAAAVFVPAMVDLCLLWIALAAVLWLAERSAWLFVVVWSGLFLLLPRAVVNNLMALTGGHGYHTTVVGAVPMLALGTVAVWRRRDAAALFERVQVFAATLLGFAALFGLVLLIQLAWFNWKATELNPAPRLHQRDAPALAAQEHPRVVWILLDELSFDQVYGRRFPGLDLPAFDALAADSTVFTQVTPAGERTSIIVPSLMTGWSVDQLRVSADGELRAVHDPDAGVWRTFDPHQTIFQDALSLGYSTAVAGWFNPYCRILPEVLDRCFWTLQRSRLTSGRFLTTAIGGPFNALGLAKIWPAHDADQSAKQIEDYRDLVQAGDNLLADSSVSFIFLHLPIPHPWGIYDRRKQQFNTAGTSSYLDNLALADHYLAHVRELLESRGEWDSSAVVVMGDHSWRTQLLWAGAAGWTAEDEAASHGGQFDKRPAYVVKLPNQHDGARIDAPFDAVRTRALLDAILMERLHTSGELREWIAQGPR